MNYTKDTDIIQLKEHNLWWENRRALFFKKEEAPIVCIRWWLHAYVIKILTVKK